MCVAGLVLATAALGAFANGTDERLVFEPTPEAPDAQKLGAPDIEKAQKLAKAKQFADAASLLEGLSKRLPASVHDCNLALAYLRASALTRAQLAWDLSGLRNGVRPKWCTGEVSTQLSDALRAAKYVPTALDIVPADALVEVGGVALRNMRTVWLRAEPTTVTASAPGKVTQTITVTIAPPSARIAITLEAPRPVLSPDAGVVVPMATPDAAVYVPPPALDAAVAQTPPADEDALIRVGGSPLGYRVVSLSVAVVGWVGAGVFGYLTYKAKDNANGRYASDPEFDEYEEQYRTNAAWTIGTAALGAVATGVYIYFLTQGDKVIPKPGRIRVGGDGDGGFGVSYSGTFGGGK